MGLIVRLLLIAGGAIAGLFYAQDTYHFPYYQMIFGIFILTAFVALLAFWPGIWAWIKNAVQNRRSS